MTTLSAKMSYPGMSSSYQSFYQPVRHNGFSNSHHMGSYPPHNSRLTQQQQPSVLQSQPASFPSTFPHPNNNTTQTQGDRWLQGVSLAQKGNKEDSSTTIKSETITNTEISPSQSDPPDRSSQQPIVNNGASKPMNTYNQIILPAGVFPQPHRVISYNQARPPGAFPQPHEIVKPQIPRTWTRAPGGVFPQAHTVVRPQIARTWVPVRQPFTSNAPRAPVNSVLTQKLQNNHLKNVQQPGGSWVVTEKNFRDASALFKKADANNDGYVSGLEVRDIFIRTGLSQENLIHIWDLVDTKQEGQLNCEQFALAMWITTRTAYSNIPPPKKLTPEMIPPSMRVKASTPTTPKQYIQKETMSSPSTLLSNIMQFSKNGTIPKPARAEKPKKVTAKTSKPGIQTVEDVYGCPNCSLMYDDSQHSPRQLPCSHTFCIDCIDTALDQDNIKCFKCKTSHTTLAAADFPVNVYIVELLKRYFAEKSDEERERYLHDADACFYCVNDHEPPLKRAKGTVKVGDRKSKCDRGSSQENIPIAGCEMDNMDGKSNNIDGISEPRVNCDGSENIQNSLSVLENGSQGKENIMTPELEVSSLDTSVSKNCGNMEDDNDIDIHVNSHPNITKNNKEVENVAGSLNEIVGNHIDRLSGKENVGKNSTGVIINKENALKTKVNEFDSAHLDLQSKNSTEVIINKEIPLKTKENSYDTAHSDLQNKWLSSIQAREKACENQRVKPRENTSKIDENMNSLSVDKFLEEIL